MIDFELSDGLKNMQQLTHQAAEMAMRPIAREYDEREHEKRQHGEDDHQAAGIAAHEPRQPDQG